MRENKYNVIVDTKYKPFEKECSRGFSEGCGKIKYSNSVSR
jgi:hypothetical protein